MDWATYDELLVPNCNREIAVESDAEVFRVISLISDDVLKQ